MNSASSAPLKRDGDARGVLVALIGAVIAALLVVANLQLAQIGNDDTTAERAAPGTESALPPPTQGTSNDVLSSELQRLSRNLSSPLNLLRNQLGPLSGLSAGQADVASSFQNVASSVRELGSVQQDLSALSSGLGDVVGNTKAMAGSLGGTNAALHSMSQNLDSTSGATRRMVRVIRRLNESLAATGTSTNESMSRMSGGIEAMGESMASTNQFLASTSTETRAMGESLVRLNANMEAFLSLFCTLLTSETSCEGGEASALAIPDPPTEAADDPGSESSAVPPSPQSKSQQSNFRGEP